MVLDNLAVDVRRGEREEGTRDKKLISRWRLEPERSHVIFDFSFSLPFVSLFSFAHGSIPSQEKRHLRKRKGN